MCIIIVTKKPFAEMKSKIERACEQNRDGWGVTILERRPKTDQIYVDRGLSDGQGALRDVEALFGKIEADYKRNNLEKQAAPWWVFHARITSRGKSTWENLHPFKLKNVGWLYHNGTLNMGDRDKCDTKLLASIIDRSALKFGDIVSLLNEFSGQKFALVNSAKLSVRMIGYWTTIEKDIEYHSHGGLSYYRHNDLPFQRLSYPGCKNNPDASDSPTKILVEQDDQITIKKGDTVQTIARGWIQKSLLEARLSRAEVSDLSDTRDFFCDSWGG